MPAHKVVSLFSGAGGLDLGFKQLGGFEVIFANDILYHTCLTYSKNFGLSLVRSAGKEAVEAEPKKVFACDVAKVDFSPLSDHDVDVVVGGPPCQDFSIIRGPSWDRRGIEVKRGRLYAHFVRALVALQPKAFVFENVPGLVSANKGLAYRVVLEDFSNLKLRWEEVKKVISYTDNNNAVEGYELVFAGVVDFSKLGVPQRRERLVVIGVRKDLIKRGLLKLWSIKGMIENALNGGRWLFKKYPLTTIEVFEGKPLPELEDVYREVMRKWGNVWSDVGTEKALRWKKEVWDKLTFNIVQDYLSANKIGRASEDELERAFKEHESLLRGLGFYGVPVASLKLSDSTTELSREGPAVTERMRSIPPDENHEFVRGTKWEVEGRGISLVYRRMHPLKPSYTVVAYGGGGTHGYHYDRDRATLTLREKARLQTFPDSFLFCGRKTEIRAQIGEAVPPLAGKAIAEALSRVFEMLEG
ncbi:MAG: DNA cytosine methyltransferase [Candidatus Freyarchaeota archaeon]